VGGVVQEKDPPPVRLDVISVVMSCDELQQQQPPDAVHNYSFASSMVSAWLLKEPLRTLRTLHPALCRCSGSLQAYPFVARKVLRDEGSAAAALLRDLVYDDQGRVRPGRLSALLQVCSAAGGGGVGGGVMMYFVISSCSCCCCCRCRCRCCCCCLSTCFACFTFSAHAIYQQGR
jgi:hypothetical protein